MSTHSVIGTTDNVTYDGIYCHYDGHPRAMVYFLAKIIARDGADALLVIMGSEQRAKAGKPDTWHTLHPETPAPDTALPYGDEARDHTVEGFGIISTAGPIYSKKGPVSFSGPLADADTAWADWMYLFTEDLTLRVFECRAGTIAMEVTRFSYDDLVALASDSEATDAWLENMHHPAVCAGREPWRPSILSA